MIEALRTGRLLIRRFTPQDLADFLAYQADPRVREYQHGQPMDAERAAQYLAAQAAVDERATGCWHGYAVQLAGPGTVIGDIGVYLAAVAEGGAEAEAEGDVGFQFHPGFHRQGYGLEAMTAFLGYVFGPLGLDRVTAGCDRANTASRALLERLGLRPRTPFIADDTCHYDLTRDQWRGQPRCGRGGATAR